MLRKCKEDSDRCKKEQNSLSFFKIMVYNASGDALGTNKSIEFTQHFHKVFTNYHYNGAK